MFRRKGFTLIELLVVIAIIAILAAILFPIFVTAKQASFKASCASNFRQISYAYRMYLSDFGDYYPSNDFGANLFLVEPYLRSKKYKTNTKVWDKSVWLCPGAHRDMYYKVQDDYWTDIGATPPWGSGTECMVFNSYTVNDDVTTKPVNPYRPGNASEVSAPSRTVFFAEGCWTANRKDLGTAPTAVHPTGEPQEVTGWCKHFKNGSRSEIHPWHIAGANFLFVDSHVAFCAKPPDVSQWQVKR